MPTNTLTKKINLKVGKIALCSTVIVLNFKDNLPVLIAQCANSRSVLEYSQINSLGRQLKT